MKLEKLRLALTARPLDVFSYFLKEGYLELDPPYQRGDVWGTTRRRNLIRSILLGVPIPSIILNDRFAAGWGEGIAVIDGKQRITTILKFMDGELSVPGEWFGLGACPTFYDLLPLTEQRRFRNHPLSVCEGQLPSLEAEQEVFDLVNFGGVPQGESDLADVSSTPPSNH